MSQGELTIKNFKSKALKRTYNKYRKDNRELYRNKHVFTNIIENLINEFIDYFFVTDIIEENMTIDMITD
jgi:hypothetical protein